jgi:S-DNA-T family DNA segregation ATPase FtsK/SpoIIIE
VARKDPDNGSRGGSDILGIVLLGLSLLLFAALFTFDKYDLAAVRTPPNDPPHNWTGRFGAELAHGLFFTLGAGAYLVPVLLLGFGLAQFIRPLAYLRRKWPWALLLAATCAGALDLATNHALLGQMAHSPGGANPGFLERLAFNLHAPGAGGVLGRSLNDVGFGYFGTVGAAILYACLYLISLYGLTNFQLGDWVRALWARWRAPTQVIPGDEKSLEKRTRELEKEARRLQEELERALAQNGKGSAKTGPEIPPATQTGLGPDLKPVPEPTVRDLSVPQLRVPSDKPKSARATPAPAETEPEINEIIPAREVAAATTADILGKAPTPGPVPAPAAESPAEDSPPATSPPGAPASAAPAPAPAAAPSGSPAASAPAPSPPPRPAPAPKPRPKPLAVSRPPQIGNYKLPPLDLLALPDLTVKPTESKEELMANARLMQQTLAQFDIQVTPGDITKGPTITRYELHPAPGVKLEKITALTNNIAAALKAERIHILAPVPGKSSVGVEVPNRVKSKVILRELLESEEWRTTKARIPLALGKDVYGHPLIGDLADMPHLLIAGSTGSGKSVCINAIVASLLYRFAPDQLRFVMIDPKVVELQQYNSLPHLVVPVVTDPKKVILALRWVVSEMEKRYQIFARVGVRNIKAFNERPKDKPLPPREPELPLAARKEKIEPGTDGFAVQVDEDIVVPEDEDIVIPDKLSYIVVIIDELADLMLVAPADVEMAIARITQMARAAGIHCIVATQRPSVDVITGVIKANIPARIAFQVASRVDSRTILDAMGADKLLGKGDMLYLPPGSAKLIRAQGALVTDPEIAALVDFIARQGKPLYDLEIHQQLAAPGGGGDPEGCGEDEDLIQQCIEVIRSEQKASVSLLQRRLRLGYTRAARIMDELENRGIVGPSKGAEPRDILIDLDGRGADGNPPAGA